MGLADGRPSPSPVRFTHPPLAIAAGGWTAWVVLREGHRLARVDLRTRRLVGRPIAVGRDPYNATLAAGSVWVTSAGEDVVTQVDARTGRVVGKVPAGDAARDVAAGFGSVWVTNANDGTVTRIDPTPQG